MTPTVGVATPSALTGLKRQLLLVDQIAVVHDATDDWDFRSENPSLAADLDWLEEQGAVFRTDFSLGLESGIDELRCDGNKVVILPGGKPGIFSFRIADSGIPKSGPPFTVAHLLEVLNDICCREECQILRNSRGVETVSLFSPSKVSLSGRVSTIPTTVNSVIIKALPEPDDSTPFEQILEFKEDSSTKSKLLELRRWMSRLTHSSISPIEAAQELEWLLQQYEDHMRLHRLKVNRGMLETVVTMTGEIAENLIKLKLGNLARLPFLITERRIALLEAERSAPGREVAYIYKAHNSFGRASQF
jgi:hypothetical protein